MADETVHGGAKPRRKKKHAAEAPKRKSHKKSRKGTKKSRKSKKKSRKSKKGGSAPTMARLEREAKSLGIPLSRHGVKKTKARLAAAIRSRKA